MMSIITPDWPAPPNVAAGTSTKLAPVGVLPRELQYLNQVHGAEVVPIEKVRTARAPIDADAVTGSQPGDHCAVRTADCLPILFCARDGSEIAAAHGGWRGVQAGIIEATIAALDFLERGPVEVVLSGGKEEALRRDLWRALNARYLPNAIAAHARGEASGEEELPLLRGRAPKEEGAILYLCREGTCLAPVGDPAAVADALANLG